MDFTHIDKDQKPTMVDVSEKAITERVAIAESFVRLGSEIMIAFKNSEWSSKKGPILDTAIIAGMMAAKKTSE